MTNIYHDFKGTQIIHGDVLHVLPTFPDGLFGVIITDPPYASGAADQNARQRATSMKYTSVKGGNPLPDFEGDAKDQRSWTHWMAEWLNEARRVPSVHDRIFHAQPPDRKAAGGHTRNGKNHRAGWYHPRSLCRVWHND